MPTADGWTVWLQKQHGVDRGERAGPGLGGLRLHRSWRHRLSACCSRIRVAGTVPRRGASHLLTYVQPLQSFTASHGPRTARAIMSWSMKVTAETDKQRWEREVLEPALKKSPERRGPFTTISGRPIDRLYTPDDLAGLRLRARPQPSRRLPLHARHSPDGLSRQALDDAAVCRVRDAGGDQRALQDAARRRRHGPERRLRPADADGPRPRPRAVARRSGEVRRQHRLARRHGAAVRRHHARRHHDVDDDQLAGADDLRDVPRRRREAGRGLADAVGHDPERHPERVHRAEGVHLPAAPVDAAHHRRLRVLREGSAALEHRLGQRLSHPRGGIDGAAGAGVHAARRHRVRAVRHRRGARRRRLRAADLVLLQLAQRLLRGDRQVPRRAQALGGGDARPVRRPATSARGSCASTPRPPACR